MKSRPPRNKWFFRTAAITAAIVPFLALEFGLQIFGVSDDQTRLKQGLLPAIPLFSLDEDTQRYRTSLPYQQFFSEVSFLPKGTQKHPKSDTSHPEKLIFVLGGSTVQGRPFGPETAFPAWAEDFLNLSVESARVRVVNCGGVSFASDRLSRLVPELLTYEPDLIVIATGHNEFLEDHTYSRSHANTGGSSIPHAFSQLKTVALIRDLIKPDSMPKASAAVPLANHEVRAKLDNTAGYETYHYDPEWHDEVVHQFRESITGMIEQCQAAKVPVCLMELAANSRDCAPLKSEHSPSISDVNRNAWLTNMQNAEASIESSDWTTAISSLNECVSRSPEHALSHFRLASCLRANDQFEKASRHYQLAVDHDICPLRMKSELRESIRSLADELSIPLVDCHSLLNPMLENRCSEFGFELFLDHVHPTIRGHQVIGRKLAETIEAIGITTTADMKQQTEESLLFKTRIDELSPAYFSNGRRRIRWLENWARAQKTTSEIVPITVSDLTQRIRRQLELRDTTTVRQLSSVLVKTSDGSQRLLELAEDFHRSGQNQPASLALTQIIQREFPEAMSRRFRRIQNHLQSNLEQSIEIDVATDHVAHSEVLLSEAQRSLVADILEQGEN